MEPASPPPTALDHLRRHARERPDRVAVIDFTDSIPYRRFYADAKRFRVALEELGIRHGQTVLTSHPNSYIHWLLIIACEALGAISCSVAEQEPKEHILPLLLQADFMLARLPPEEAAGPSIHLLTNEWLIGVLARPEQPMEEGHGLQPGEADPIRIIRSSGTTGIPKRMLLRRRMLEYCASRVIVFDGLTPDSAFHAGYNFMVNASYGRVCACLRLGATVVFGPLAKLLPSDVITHLWITAGDLLALLRDLSDGSSKREGLLVATSGSPVSTNLWDEALEKLCGRIVVGYGANEAGPSIAGMDRDAIGTPGAGVDIRILDERGEPVAGNATGTIAIRTPGVVDGYIDDAEATRQSFQGGWFITTDIGMALSGGRFRVVGRRDDMLNLGGNKLSPVDIEAFLRRSVKGLRDVAATSAPNEHGIEELCIAVVIEAGASRKMVEDLIRRSFPASVGGVRVREFESLPTTDTGKVRRVAIKDAFAGSKA